MAAQLRMAAAPSPRPELMRMLQQRRELQERQLQGFASRLPPFIELSKEEKSSKWYRHTRGMGNTSDHNGKRCYTAPSRAVPGLCGVFAAREFRLTPATGIGKAPSTNIARYSGVLMLQSEFDEYQAAHHHDMGMEVAGLRGRLGDGKEVERVIIAGSPLCLAAQINRESSGTELGGKKNCVFKSLMGATVSDDPNQAIAVDTVTVHATRIIQANEEILCDYVSGSGRRSDSLTWIDAASCLICSCAVQPEDFIALGTAALLALHCQGFINGQRCPFSMHRRCLTEKGVPETEAYCHYCYTLSAGEDPQQELLLVEFRGGIIRSNASFATVLKIARGMGWSVNTVSAQSATGDIFEYLCSKGLQQQPSSQQLRKSAADARGEATATTSPPSVGLQQPYRSSSATGQPLAAPRRVLSNALQQLTVHSEPVHSPLVIHVADSSPQLPSTADRAVKRDHSSQLSPYRALSELASHINAQTGAYVAGSGLSLHTSSAWPAYAAHEVSDTIGPPSSSNSMNSLLLGEMHGWEHLAVLLQRYGVATSDYNTAPPINQAVGEPASKSGAADEYSKFFHYIHDLVTNTSQQDSLATLPCSSFRRTFQRAHRAGRVAVTVWLTAALVQHLQESNIVSPRDAIRQLFCDAAEFLGVDCARDELCWDNSIVNCWNETLAKDGAAQRELRESELNVLVNHCSGGDADFSDDDEIINAPLVMKFLRTHVQHLEERWRQLILRGHNSTRFHSDPSYAKPCEGLVHAVICDFLRGLSHQLDAPESSVPHWGAGSMHEMMDSQQQEIIEFIKSETWSNDAVLQQVQLADHDRSHRSHVAWSSQLPPALQLTSEEGARRDLAVVLQYIVHLAYCADKKIVVASAISASITFPQDSSESSTSRGPNSGPIIATASLEVLFPSTPLASSSSSRLKSPSQAAASPAVTISDSSETVDINTEIGQGIAMEIVDHDSGWSTITPDSSVSTESDPPPCSHRHSRTDDDDDDRVSTNASSEHSEYLPFYPKKSGDVQRREANFNQAAVDFADSAARTAIQSRVAVVVTGAGMEIPYAITSELDDAAQVQSRSSAELANNGVTARPGSHDNFVSPSARAETVKSSSEALQLRPSSAYSSTAPLSQDTPHCEWEAYDDHSRDVLARGPTADAVAIWLIESGRTDVSLRPVTAASDLTTVSTVLVGESGRPARRATAPVSLSSSSSMSLSSSSSSSLIPSSRGASPVAPSGAHIQLATLYVPSSSSRAGAIRTGKIIATSGSSVTLIVSDNVIGQLNAARGAHVEKELSDAAPSDLHKKQKKLGTLTDTGKEAWTRWESLQKEPVDEHSVCENKCSINRFLDNFRAFNACCGQRKRDYFNEAATMPENSPHRQQAMLDMLRHYSILHHPDSIMPQMYLTLLSHLKCTDSINRQEFFDKYGPQVDVSLLALLQQNTSFRNGEVESLVNVPADDIPQLRLNFGARVKLFGLEYGGIAVCLKCFCGTHSWFVENTVRRWINIIARAAALKASSSASMGTRPPSATGRHGNSLRSRVPHKLAAAEAALVQVARTHGDATPDANVTVLAERTLEQVRTTVNNVLAANGWGIPPVSLSTIRIALDHLPFIKRSGKHKTLPQCDTCVTYRAISQPTDDEKVLFELHNAMQVSERAELARNINMANNNPNEHLYIAIDGMDQSKTELPHLCNMPHWRGDSAFTPLKVHVTGAMVHGPNQTLIFTHYQNVRSGGNLTVHLLNLTLRKVWKEIEQTMGSLSSSSISGQLPATLPRCFRFPKHLVVQMDNSGKDNKNNAVFKFLALLVHRGVFDTVRVHFLIVGHTHDRVDQMFSCISREMQNNDVYTHSQLRDSIFDAYARPVAPPERAAALPEGKEEAVMLSTTSVQASEEALNRLNPELGVTITMQMDASDSADDGNGGAHRDGMPEADERFADGLTLDPLCRQRPDVIHVDSIADWTTFLNEYVPAAVSNMNLCQAFKIYRNYNGDVALAAKMMTSTLRTKTSKKSGKVKVSLVPQDFAAGRILILATAHPPITDPVQHPFFKLPLDELRESAKKMSSFAGVRTSSLPVAGEGTTLVQGTIPAQSRHVARCWDQETCAVWNEEINRVERVGEVGQCEECVELIRALERGAAAIPSQKKVRVIQAVEADQSIRELKANQASLTRQLHQHLADPAVNHSRCNGHWTNEFQPCTPGFLDPVLKVLPGSGVSESRLQEDARLRLEVQAKFDLSQGEQSAKQIIDRVNRGPNDMNRQRLLRGLKGVNPNDTIINIIPRRSRKGGVVGDVVQTYPVRTRTINKGDVIATMPIDNFFYPEYVVCLAVVVKVQRPRAKRKGSNQQSGRQKRSAAASRSRSRDSPADRDADEDAKQEAKEAAAGEEKDIDGQTVVTVVYYYLQYPNYRAACHMLDRKIDHFKEHGKFGALYKVFAKWDPTVSDSEAAASGEDDDEMKDGDENVDESLSDDDSDQESSSGHVPSHPRVFPKHPLFSELWKVWIPFHKEAALDLKLLEKAERAPSSLKPAESEIVKAHEDNKDNPYTWHETFDFVNVEFKKARPAAAILKTIPPFFTVVDYETAGLKWRLLPESVRVTEEVRKDRILCWVRKEDALDDDGNIVLSFVELLQAAVVEFHSRHGWFADGAVEEEDVSGSALSQQAEAQQAAVLRGPERADPLASSAEGDIAESDSRANSDSAAAPMEIATPAIAVVFASESTLPSRRYPKRGLASLVSAPAPATTFAADSEMSSSGTSPASVDAHHPLASLT